MATRYERFEDLPVWQAAADLYGFSEGLLVQPELVASPGWRDQFDRAALSISSYVAHGFECGHARDQLFAIAQARAAVGEVRSMLRVLERRKIPREVQVPVSRLKALAESCARQLREWAESIQELPPVEAPAASRGRQRRRNLRPSPCEVKERATPAFAPASPARS